MGGFHIQIGADLGVGLYVAGRGCEVISRTSERGFSAFMPSLMGIR